MTQYIRMVIATGAVEHDTLREGPPVLFNDQGQQAFEVKGFRWLEVIPQVVEVWQGNGPFPTEVDPNATTITRTLTTLPLAEWKTRLVNQLRIEAGRRINTFAPQHLQNNILARAIEITRKRATNAELTAQDLSDEEACLNLWATIESVRNACNAAEAGVNAAETHADAKSAYDSVAWPA